MVHQHSSVSRFLSCSKIEEGIHSISVNNYIVDFLFKRNKSKHLIVVFSGAVNRDSDNKPPFFFGLGLHKLVDCSLMAINDPSLYLNNDITLAWYTGSKNLPLQSLLPSIIDKVASLCDSTIIMLGGSGGGFASLYYVSKTINPAIALVFNPQTNILNYYQRTVEYYSKVCFNYSGGDVETSLEVINYDLTKICSENKSQIIYLQNSSDYRHILKHAIPFLKSYKAHWTGFDIILKELYLHVGNWAKGHRPPSRDFLAYIINEIVSGKTIPVVFRNLPDHLKSKNLSLFKLFHYFLNILSFLILPISKYLRRFPLIINFARFVYRFMKTCNIVLHKIRDKIIKLC